MGCVLIDRLEESLLEDFADFVVVGGDGGDLGDLFLTGYGSGHVAQGFYGDADAHFIAVLLVLDQPPEILPQLLLEGAQ